MRLHRMLLVLLCLTACLTAWMPVHAMPADGASYEHRHWTRTDGAPAVAVAIAQSSDGMMWFATPDGLFSFDGIRFNASGSIWGHKLLASNFASLRAIPDGLAVGYRFGGLSVFRKDAATHYLAGRDFPEGMTNSIVVDAGGTLYAATTNAIVYLHNGRWTPVDITSLPPRNIAAIVFDDEGTLWVLLKAGLYAKAAGAHAFVLMDKSITEAKLVHGKISALAPGGRHVRLSATAQSERLTFDAPHLYRDSVVEGPDRTLWTTRREGIVRLGYRQDGSLQPLETFGLPRSADSQMFCSMVDMEDNLWIVTLAGIERFRPHRAHQIARALGIVADKAAHGLEGHWGITGMRERIAGIGGKFDIAAGANGGTVVRFQVAAAVAYLGPSETVS